jgi:hypothetical protein
MVSAIIHLANRDYRSLVDDFINLEILPADCDRAKVEPLMDKALTPYVKGGGAQRYEQELKKIYKMDGTLSSTAGGFQQMTQDALTVLNDIPFSIPAYFALLGRAIVTLEGIALTGDPEYGIIMEAYPFISRKLLREDRPAIQKALQQVLYTAGGGGMDGMSGARLSALLQSAMGDAVRESGAVIDLDHVSGELDLAKTVKLLMGESGKSLRTLLQSEAVTITELLLRQNLRRPNFQRLAVAQSVCARKGVESANTPRQHRGGQRPIDQRFLLVDLGGVSEAVFCLRDDSQVWQLRQGLHNAFGAQVGQLVMQAGTGFIFRQSQGLTPPHGAGVQAFFHLHDAYAALRVAGFDGALNRRGTAPARQQRSMDIQATQGRAVQRPRGKQQTIGHHHHGVCLGLCDGRLGGSSFVGVFAV